jgi:hypothetical protein
VPPEIVARGHGADEVEALRDLWQHLTDHDAPNEALTVVADAYMRRTGRAPTVPAGTLRPKAATDSADTGH